MTWIKDRAIGAFCPECGADLISRGGMIQCARLDCDFQEQIRDLVSRLVEMGWERAKKKSDLLDDVAVRVEAQAGEIADLSDQLVGYMERVQEAERRAQVLADAAADLEAEGDSLKSRLFDLREAWDRLRAAPAGADVDALLDDMESAFRAAPRPPRPRVADIEGRS